ncbi:MAG: hypothetical protein ABI480_08375 [Chitinophagaceae bacterium]
MKFVLQRFLTGIFYVSFFIGCSGTDSGQASIKNNGNKLKMGSNYSTVDYTATILQIDKKSENSGTWETLFTDKEFIDIYEHSSSYIDSAIRFLTDEKYSLHQKTVCIYSMQRAKLEDYVLILEQCANLFEKEKIPELLLKRAISPTFGKKRPVIENYNDANVKRILESIKGDGKVSQEFKTTIEKILSGEYWNNIKDSLE